MTWEVLNRRVRCAGENPVVFRDEMGGGGGGGSGGVTHRCSENMGAQLLSQMPKPNRCPLVRRYSKKKF